MNKTELNMKDSQNIKPGYKKTAVGVIPEDWEVMKMKDISKVNQGLQIPIAKRYLIKEEDTLFYITNEFLKKNSKLNYFIKKPPKNVICNEDDVLMTRTGNTGKVVSGVNGAFHNNFFKIDFNRNILEKNYFITYLNISQTQHNILVLAGNSTIPDLNHSDFYRLLVPIPPLPEQKAIADCLSTWDKAIEKQTQLIETKKQFKKGLMQGFFSGQLTVKNGQLRVVRSKEGEDFTGDWKEVKLEEIAKRVTRKNEELNDTVVTISAQRGFVLQEEFFNKRVASETLTGYYLMHKGEFAYNKSYSNGYPMGAFKRLDDFEKAVVTTLYICFSAKKNVNSDFLLYYFDAGMMIPKLMKIAQEGGRAHGLLNIGLSDFFNLKLKLPTMEVQNNISNILKTTDKEIKLQERKLEQLQLQKKGLMQVLLTGEKRLKIGT